MPIAKYIQETAWSPFIDPHVTFSSAPSPNLQPLKFTIFRNENEMLEQFRNFPAAGGQICGATRALITDQLCLV
jgi:hypothetical protein